VALLADTLGLARADVKLITGGSSRDKVVEVRGLDGEEAERRLGRGAKT
jgi:uncharacterized protein YggU (UPF0235/DUF167 family)